MPILPLKVGTKYKVKSGLQVEIIRELQSGRFVGVVIRENGVEEIYFYTTGGYALDSFNAPCEKFDIEDLWREKKKRVVVGFTNVYDTYADVFGSYSEALTNLHHGAIAKAIRFEHEVEFEVQG